VGQTGGTLLINGTTESNNTVVRCLIYNGGGSILTNNFTIFVSSIPVGPPGGPGDGCVSLGGAPSSRWRV
jgi:hypothetical protein